ncbi:phage virion morphogenesis protein [Pseudomonas oryzihabitans]|nr:phage virion morphogenesis protein [Pseudomonas oryzihabitans]
MARKAAQQLRRSQQQRIRNQVNPDGSPFRARKPRDLRGKKDRIKRRMFEKLKMARYLKAKGSPQQAVIGFVSRVSPHRPRSPVRPERPRRARSSEVRYARRKLLGLSDQDLHTLRDLLLDQLDI